MRDYSVTCHHCGIVFQRSRTNPKQRFCSRNCVNAYRTAHAKNTPKIHTLVCEHCGTTFTNKHIKQRFCSHACGNSEYVDKTRICEQCGKTYKYAGTNPKQRLCSSKCVGAFNGALRKRKEPIPQKPCEHCGKLFEIIYPDKRYCSRKCYGAALRTRMQLAYGRDGINASKSPTKPEMKMREALTTLGIQFFAEYPFFWYSVDFFLPRLNVALEVDGVYWHTQKYQVDHDARRDRYIIAKGIKVVRITDVEINETDNLAELVKERLISI